MLTGWKTILIGVIGLVWAVLGSLGVQVPLEDQAHFSDAVIFVIMLVMRVVSSTPSGVTKMVGGGNA